MRNQIKQRLRCAVYTRKSTEEGLEQDYNSIDAQRDAGHAYIASQRAEGWIPVDNDYDDPAYSGGNMERPALKRLLADIEDGRVDVVVVYKIDRLTRSLTDFSKMIDTFERNGASFVSVTQQFNTTNSMGRLMLNILLSFAQFEREVTGERIRDKITASKKKGLWMGGIPPLGYDVKDRLLVKNTKEAKLIQHIFKRFTEIGSTTLMVKELRLDGATSKSWTTQDGRFRPGKPIDKGMIYKLLHNRTYLGELRHKDKWYQGVHEAIIDQKLWEDVHSILTTNSRTRGNQTRAKIPFLLKGIIFGEDGRALTTSHTYKKKNGRRYRYYLSTHDTKEFAGASGLPRFPAAELEAAVVGQIRALLRAPQLTPNITEIASELGDDIDEAQVTVALSKIDKIWEQLFPGEQSRILNLLIEKIIVTSENIDVRLRNNGIEKLALEITGSAQKGDSSMSNGRGIQIEVTQTGKPKVIEASDGTTSISVPIRMKRRSGRQLISLPNGETQLPRPWDTEPTPLQLALARGHHWMAMLENGEAQSMREIADKEGVDNSYVSRMINLTTLAPDIVAAILDDQVPPHLTLFELAVDPPRLWEEQRSVIMSNPTSEEIFE